ncbi:hypothetical protein [Paludisphaera rhizosphaerae]|uniref:hypothetical protein n=1 Tax=Paludisphaera rhizosphaerae TaxID=2711216 RepID=UPI0013ED7DAB|nr:hypothetical protein [Paludisphaera rhizosphaerae]
MTTTAVKSSLAVVVCGLVAISGANSAADFEGPDPQAELLKSKGVDKVKGTYRLASEADVYGRYEETLAAMDAAAEAIERAGAVAATNQSIINFHQRIAFDRAFVGEMKLAKRDGKTLEEQTAFRAGKADIKAAQRERAMQGQAKTKAQPKAEARLAKLAEEACQAAESKRSALAERVREVVREYETLAADPDVRTALGDAKLTPSDGFLKLAAVLKIAKPRKANALTESPGRRPREIDEAIAQLKSARDALKTVPFRKGADQFEERDKRRNDTIKLIENAIGKLDQGEDASKLLDEAVAMNKGYGVMNRNPRARDALDEAGSHLQKAVDLLHGLTARADGKADSDK